MKVVILAGGLGTRLAEETSVKPKPMVEVGGYPILWHIMNIYACKGFQDFVIALGYKGELIKDYFLRYHATNSSDLTVHLGTGTVDYTAPPTLDVQVHLVDTGHDSLTGGRLHRLRDHLVNDGTFMLTYGDGVANVDVASILEFHRRHGKIATLTAVRPPARFGTMTFDGDQVAEFEEKPQTGEGWINGGFFVFEPAIFDYLDGDQTILERAPLENLAADGQLMAYKHEGFWQCMDTVRDLKRLQELWEEGTAPWQIWEPASIR